MKKSYELYMTDSLLCTCWNIKEKSFEMKAFLQICNNQPYNFNLLHKNNNK